MPRICAALEGRQSDHQSTMVEMEGKISTNPISILVDLGACWSYVSPKIVEFCKLNKVKHNKPCMVQLDTDTKINIFELRKGCKVEMNRFPAEVYFSILALKSYDILIGMY